jgi:UDP-N-acetylglucosamine/UDP-N-acetylgalactosamine diphosphorylase
MEIRYQVCQRELARRGQSHLLRWWDDLTPVEREHLLGEIESIPWGLLDSTLSGSASAGSEEEAGTLGDLEPAPVYPANPGDDLRALYERARARGAELIAGGKVAAFTVAGGQGTRLGFDGPKGMVPITPVRGKSLFQLFAETILAVGKRFGVSIPWYIMTSPANHERTVAYLRAHNHFGLPERDVFAFVQGQLPALDFWGKILLECRHRLALAPDGHGGSLKALVESGALADMRDRGVEIISYFQVDNPLVKPVDPLFIGLHALTGSEMSTKVARKADDLERVGNVCMSGGKPVVVEYTEFPESLARERDADGTRQFDAANLAIHLLDVAFVEKLGQAGYKLPLHFAEKMVPCIDEWGQPFLPDKANAIKLEAFIFDALRFASNPLVLEVERAEEFSPVKNASGADSIETAKRDLVRRAARQLERIGMTIPRDDAGDPKVELEIDPRWCEEALTPSDIELLRKAIVPGAAVYIE